METPNTRSRRKREMMAMEEDQTGKLHWIHDQQLRHMVLSASENGELPLANFPVTSADYLSNNGTTYTDTETSANLISPRSLPFGSSFLFLFLSPFIGPTP